VQEVCTRVAIIAVGKIADEGPPDELLARAGRRYRLETSDLAGAAEICGDLQGLSNIEVDMDRIGFVIDGEPALLGLAGALTDAEIAIQSLTLERVTLEQVCFELTETARSADEAIA
jgi:ABC-type multidrug transport system ATPase subunit